MFIYTCMERRRLSIGWRAVVMVELLSPYLLYLTRPPPHAILPPPWDHGVNRIERKGLVIDIISLSLFLLPYPSHLICRAPRFILSN